jgi:hypothetical protein
MARHWPTSVTFQEFIDADKLDALSAYQDCPVSSSPSELTKVNAVLLRSI